MYYANTHQNKAYVAALISYWCVTNYLGLRGFKQHRCGIFLFWRSQVQSQPHRARAEVLHGKQMGKQWKQCQTLFWGAPKSLQMVIAAMELKFLLGSKVMTNLDSILKSRNITLLIKVLLVKAVVFPVVMYGCESWTIKKAEHQRINAFELWCWRRLLRVPWTGR